MFQFCLRNGSAIVRLRACGLSSVRWTDVMFAHFSVEWILLTLAALNVARSWRWMERWVGAYGGVGLYYSKSMTVNISARQMRAILGRSLDEHIARLPNFPCFSLLLWPSINNVFIYTIKGQRLMLRRACRRISGTASTSISPHRRLILLTLMCLSVYRSTLIWWMLTQHRLDVSQAFTQRSHI